MQGAPTGLKKCPQCGALAYQNAPNCQTCGRVYVTTNPNATQAFVPPAQPSWWWHRNRAKVFLIVIIAIASLGAWKLVTFPFAAGTYVTLAKDGTMLVLEPDGFCSLTSPNEDATETVAKGTWKLQSGEVVLDFPTIGNTSSRARFKQKDNMLINVQNADHVWYRK